MSFTASARQRSSPTLPLAAMVDILFLLLVFFMTALVFRDYDRVIDVILPGTETDLPGAPVTPILITVKADGQIYIGNSQYDLNKLRATLAVRGRDYPDDWIDIRGDSKCEHGKIIGVFDAVRAAGLHNIRIHTRPVEHAGSDE